jgi:hypothetical protein
MKSVAELVVGGVVENDGKSDPGRKEIFFLGDN